jgi:hypothetical protein
MLYYRFSIEVIMRLRKFDENSELQSKCPVSRVVALVTGSSPSSLKPLQNKVHEVILSVGGYFSPLSAVARLLEEIGELVEVVDLPTDPQKIGDELTDVCIIGMCLANQYLVKLVARQSARSIVGDPTQCLQSLIKAAGQSARIVNFYEGDKLPKPNERIVGLAESLCGLANSAIDLACCFDLDLLSLIAQRLEFIRLRDANRFPRKFDACSAEVLGSVERIKAKTLCPFAASSKVWGTPDFDPLISVQDNGKELGMHLKRFSKINRYEELDALAYRIPTAAVGSLLEFGNVFGSLMKGIEEDNASLLSIEETSNWSISFFGESYFIATFTPFYESHHPRYAEDSGYCVVLFQPLRTFKRHPALGKLVRERMIGKIRDAFKRAGRGYREEKFEVCKYVKPLNGESPLIDWWRQL